MPLTRVKYFNSLVIAEEDAWIKFWIMELCQSCLSIGLRGIKSIAVTSRVLSITLTSTVSSRISIFHIKVAKGLHVCYVLYEHVQTEYWKKGFDKLMDSGPISNKSNLLQKSPLTCCIMSLEFSCTLSHESSYAMQLWALWLKPHIQLLC